MLEKVSAIVDRYLALYPEETASLSLFRRQLADHDTVFDRRNFVGHITAGGIILSSDHTQVLLVHNIVHDRWLQPGGHYEPTDTGPLEAALREIHEETGIEAGLRYLPVDARNPGVPATISSHPVRGTPAKQEEDHYHHDFRYVFEIGTTKITPQLSEVRAAQWFDLYAPEVAELLLGVNRLKKL